jgi:hypothetical protein
MFHWVTKTDNGFRVTDVWQITSEPQVTFYEVHNYLTAG